MCEDHLRPTPRQAQGRAREAAEAFVLSALIGLQRELRQESAGLRTLAACTSRGTATEPAAWLSDVDGVLAVTAGDVDEDADQRGPAGGHPGAGIFPAPSLLTWSCR